MIRKTFVKMSLPQIFASISSTLCLLIDSIMMGRFLGVQAISAYGLSSPLIIIFTATVLMVNCGTQITVAKAVGKGDRDEIDTCYSTSIAIAVSVSVLLTFIIFIAADPIGILLEAGKKDVPLAVTEMMKDYLKGYFILSPFIFLNQLMMPYLQIMGKRREILLSVISMTVSDVLFNFLSIHVFNAGIFGIGLASGLSYLVAFFTAVWFFLKKDCIFRFSFKGIRGFMAAAIARAGSCVILVQLCYVLRVYSFNQLLLNIGGADAVAVFSIITVPADILFRIGFGAGETTLSISSLLYGDEDRGSLIELVKSMYLCTFIYISIAVLLVCLAAPWIVLLYVPAEFAMYDAAVMAMRLFSVSFVISSMGYVNEKYLLGTGHMGLVNLLSASEGLLLTASFAWIFGLIFGFEGVWIGVIIGQTGTLLVYSVFAWRKAGKVSFSAETYSYLDKDFGVDPDNISNYYVSDVDSAESASESLHAFYKDRGVKAREAMLISLCTEEIAMNIIKHGFNADKAKHNMEIRTVRKDNGVTLRFRDDCIMFEPTKYVEMNDDDGSEDHIGLRMIMKMVDDATYINSLGLNNLMLSIRLQEE